MRLCLKERGGRERERGGREGGREQGGHWRNRKGLVLWKPDLNSKAKLFFKNIVLYACLCTFIRRQGCKTTGRELWRTGAGLTGICELPKWVLGIELVPFKKRRCKYF